MAQKLRPDKRDRQLWLNYTETLFCTVMTKDHISGVVAYIVAPKDSIVFCANFLEQYKNLRDIPCEDGKHLGKVNSKGI